MLPSRAASGHSPMSGITAVQILGQSGVLSRRLQGFRERPQQLAMADAVTEALRAKRHLLVEAPTGVGKSLGYLVPALLELSQNRKKVVVTTHTIALQEQLLEKDLPLLASCLPIEFVAQKAMGRSNYLGLRRLDLALMENSGLFSDDDPLGRELDRISKGVEGFGEGRRQELKPEPNPEAWELVQSESDNCLGKACRQYDSCFFQSARRRWQNADILVANHALYVLDLALRQQNLAILPDHDAVIIDEAHTFEQVAAEHLGIEVSRRAVLHLIGRVAGRRGVPGVVQRLAAGFHDRAVALCDRVRVACLGFFDAVAEWQTSSSNENGRMRAPQIVPDGLSEPLTALAEELTELSLRLPNEEARIEVEAFAGRASQFAAAVQKVLAMEDKDSVYYTEEAAGRNPKIVARPLEVGKLLSTLLFRRMSTVVLTSATLSTQRSERGLQYAARRLGLENPTLLLLDSPFQYENRVEMHVPKGLPNPGDPGFEIKAASAIASYVRRTNGGAFILGTSFKMLESLAQLLQPELAAMGLRVLRQGQDLGRSELLRQFREDGNAVLFGADSFWQGVDVPGSALRLVILVRLPFPVPTLPYHEARAERLTQQGGSPFRDYFLPEALIKFRQGFGRLVRTEEDEGLVVCLDPRVLGKSYGTAFKNAIPKIPWIVSESEA